MRKQCVLGPLPSFGRGLGTRLQPTVSTERGGIDKHHGRSVQQETGATLAKEKGVFRLLAIPRGVH